ncbi:MAG TPA: ferredoxin [Verrucomicrobiales bacterium]|nr:ferredoxin [Verrucomicrobiales bacterium]
MPPKTRKSAPRPAAAATAKAARENRRFWLTYPTKLITTPVMWHLVKKFDVITNIRQASVSDELGILCLEIEGDRSTVKAAVRWLEKQGVSVEPVEINVIAS